MFYVATDGNNSWSGRPPKPNAGHTDGPFRTLQRAQKAIRALKAGGPLRKPVTVYIRGGKYDLSNPLVFTPEDSGTPQNPITYAAYPGEMPVISGGRAITGWKRVTNRKLLTKRYQLDARRSGVIPVIVLNIGCKSLDSIFQGSVVSRRGRFRAFKNREAFYCLLTSESDSAHDR